ncbi:MAG: DinB family protein [Acidobacteria bacterium]|nr:DinB family protein [Acidobacteriota bacterium]
MRRFGIAGLCAAVAGLAVPAIAQQKDARPIRVDAPRTSLFSDVARAAWYSINELVIASAERMPAEHYGFRPARDVRTFAQILAHIADNHHAACGPTIGRPRPDTSFDRLQTKDELTKALRESAAVCDLAYGILTDQNAAFRYPAFNSEYTRFALLVSNITHNSEHYGNLVTYMRLKAVVPPSTAGIK